MTQTNLSIVRLQAVVLVCLLALACLSGCASYETISMEVTAYSSDQESTNWRRGRILFWRAYVASGPNKGKRKIVGLTSSGKWARYGTIAADTRYYPYGTVMIIPGYGKGVVEDIGGAIKGPRRLDVYFKTRRRALKWGRQRLQVRVRR
jgi:3D (Asp-Asp-Asp) domain-containing protein